MSSVSVAAVCTCIPRSAELPSPVQPQMALSWSHTRPGRWELRAGIANAHVLRIQAATCDAHGLLPLGWKQHRNLCPAALPTHYPPLLCWDTSCWMRARLQAGCAIFLTSERGRDHPTDLPVWTESVQMQNIQRFLPFQSSIQIYKSIYTFATKESDLL